MHILAIAANNTKVKKCYIFLVTTSVILYNKGNLKFVIFIAKNAVKKCYISHFLLFLAVDK